ncbi:peptidyl-Lys metalloendopeptidase [Cylindrobasidium torrendii FP15055 ss-10]|uniref:Peptidyl-Lys metalloendopeptidase n=1 Tax=Cylindrobasidium torrendii FP15055 ss-10 TaxID=1314674 RepID=A0A0D7BL80_9AGAR|nr:peptidyl-Lys metalloendopeptidase [Cylindrobasidium torrendii FP15055 ss-10]
MSARELLVFLVLAATSALATPDLSLALSGPESVDSVGNLKIAATLTNRGDETVKILNDPKSVLSTLPADSFFIESDSGSEPSFIGAMVKYCAETAAAKGAYTSLAPGESVTVSHDLGAAYNFTPSGESRYKIAPSSNVFYIVDDAGTVSTMKAKTNASYALKLSGVLSVARPASQKGASKFNGCSSSQKNIIQTAASSANTYAVRSLSYLEEIDGSTKRYKYWFGAYSFGRKGTVQSHYSRIASYDYTRDYAYDCSTCDRAGTFAYVYPSSFGTIYLCPQFWEASNTGTDSRAGTLIHEASHFAIIGGTSDHVYGQSGAHSLAMRDPDTAIDNADNHEYFAENAPRKS